MFLAYGRRVTGQAPIRRADITDHWGTKMATKEEVVAFFADQFPQANCAIQAIGDGGATVLREIGDEDLRPGGSVSGPVLMAVADIALYAAILGAIGIVPMAVTTSFNINFMHKPEAHKGILGVCKLLKVGRTQVVGEVYLYSEGSSVALAHATGTYFIPPA
jgi:acyl-coenzyme A thioesterase PaaI-like protein